jgi:tetratricopeptide (TPR) repeat protein
MGRRKLGPAHAEIASYQTNLGVLLLERGDLNSAEPLLRDSLAICGKPNAPSRQTANVLAAYGRLQEAEPMLTESLALRQEQFGKSHPLTADALLNVASLRIAQKRSSEAVSLSREALAIVRQLLPASHALVAKAALELALALQAGGDQIK